MTARLSIFTRAASLLLAMLMISMASAADFSLFHCQNMGETHATRCCPTEQEEPQAALLASKCCESERVEVDAPRSVSSQKNVSIRPAVVVASIEVPPALASIARIEQALDTRAEARPPPMLILKCVLLV